MLWHLLIAWFWFSSLTFIKQSFITYCVLINLLWFEYVAKIEHSDKRWKKILLKCITFSRFFDLRQFWSLLYPNFHVIFIRFVVFIGILLWENGEILLKFHFFLRTLQPKMDSSSKRDCFLPGIIPCINREKKMKN